MVTRHIKEDVATMLLIPKSWNLYKDVLAVHTRIENENGLKMVKCPFIDGISYSAEDYNHSYCPNCHSFFGVTK